MDRDILIHLPVILAVARHGGFATAAKEMGMSASAVSHAVRTVEQKLGLPLFARTTRSVALTDWGASFVASVAPALTEIEDATDLVRAAQGRVTGHLRLNLPRFALPMAVAPVVQAVTERYPDLTIEVYCDDGMTDIVANRFDAGVRLGNMIAEDMIAVRLTPPFRSAVVGSPDYLREHGMPETLNDLKRHNCITYRKTYSGAVFEWPMRENGLETTVEVRGSILTTDPDYALSLALEGCGLVYGFEPLIAEHVAAGRLVEVLPKASQEFPGLFLYFPRNAARTPKLRAFIDTAREVLTMREAA